MRSFTVSELVTAARQRADIEESQVCTDDEIISYIDRSYCEYYDLLVGKYDNYFVSEYDFTTTQSEAVYDLPEDFYKLLGLDQLIGTDRYLTVRPFNFTERNRGQLSDNIHSYVLQGSEIKLFPTPGAGIQMKMWYVPSPEKITTGTQEIDGVSGWEEYVILSTVVKIMNKQDLDPSAFLNDRAITEQRIIKAAAQRDASLPATITDMNSLNEDSPYWPYRFQ